MYVYTNDTYIYTHTNICIYRFTCAHMYTTKTYIHIYTHIYIYLYIFVYMYTCICTYIYLRMIYTYKTLRGGQHWTIEQAGKDMCVCVYIYIHIVVFTYIYIYIYAFYTYIYTLIYIHTYVYIYMYIYTCMYIYMCVFMYVCIYINISIRPTQQITSGSTFIQIFKVEPDHFALWELVPNWYKLIPPEYFCSGGNERLNHVE